MKKKYLRILAIILVIILGGIYWYFTGDLNFIDNNNEQTPEIQQQEDYFARLDKVTLKEAVDGDTARFMRNGEEIKVRFVGINAPEYTSSIEPYGKEASERCAELLQNAKKIELEYDQNAGEYDNHGRVLAWIWVDDELLQAIMINEGLATNKYLKKNYKFYDELMELERKAKKNKVGLWQDN